MPPNNVRHTPFASWKDPDAWMEKMSGPRWQAVLKEERRLVASIAKKKAVQQDRVPEFLKVYNTLEDKFQPVQFDCGPAIVQWENAFFKLWRYKGSNQINQKEARDLFCQGEGVWTTTDIGHGAETFELQAWTSACASKPEWSHKPVGPDLGVLGNMLFYLGVKNKLIYHELWCCDAKTGKHKTLLYTEKSPEVNLSIQRIPDGQLVLVRDNSQDLDYYTITPQGLKRRHSLYLVPKSWKVPLGEYGIDFVWPRIGLLITKQHGKKTLWKCSSNKVATKLLEIEAGDLLFDPFATFNGHIPCMLVCLQPTSAPQYFKYDYNDSLIALNKPQPLGLMLKRFSAKSADGTRVYGTLLFKSGSKKPKKLLMVGYGAYGIETSTGLAGFRWAPLLENDWAIGYAFVRGGGDHTEEWGKAGRRQGRIKTIEDFEVLIQSAQLILSISPKKTAIYGRSAGGLLMGGTLARNPDASLMSAVYTEVPYVDELRTTTNTSLPLTTLEYNEFGAPLLRLEDFIGVGLLSPADSAAVTASPEIFVLTRTAENDSQVFAYESVKWIRRLRASTTKGAPKLAIVESNQGHFTPPDKTAEQWALDLSILDAWMDSPQALR
jgi:hypothetical protein